MDILGTGECVPREISESESVSVGDSGPSPRLGVNEDDPEPDRGGWLCLLQERAKEEMHKRNMVKISNT